MIDDIVRLIEMVSLPEFIKLRLKQLSSVKAENKEEKAVQLEICRQLQYLHYMLKYRNDVPPKAYDTVAQLLPPSHPTKSCLMLTFGMSYVVM
jgi:hypothetical protein